MAVRVDVTDPEECRKMADAVMARYGRIDYLVCNAAILIRAPSRNLIQPGGEKSSTSTCAATTIPFGPWLPS